MSPCQWKPGHPLDVGASRCREEAWEKSTRGLCIFHSEKNSQESVEEFTPQVLKKIEDMGNRGEGYDFFGYVFPKGFSAFSKKEFKAPVNFNEVKFGGKADFAGATFGGDAYFWSATFVGTAYFADATFGGAADFAGATFGGDAYFWSATFDKEAIFYGATFQSSVAFDGKEANGSFRGEVDFSHVWFLKPQEVYFYNLNLSKAHLAETPTIEFVHFVGVTWAEVKGRKAIWESKEHEGIEGTAVCRRLMKNFENARDYSAAGDFYIGAMEREGKRLQREMWNGPREWFEWLFHNFYRWVSFYGESYLRAAIWLVASLLLSVFFFNASVPYHEVFTKMKECPFTVLIRYIGIPTFLSLFLLALKRRFRR